MFRTSSERYRHLSVQGYREFQIVGRLNITHDAYLRSEDIHLEILLPADFHHGLEVTGHPLNCRGSEESRLIFKTPA